MGHCYVHFAFVFTLSVPLVFKMIIAQFYFLRYVFGERNCKMLYFGLS